MGYTKGISANVSLPPGNKSGGVEQLSQIMAKVKGGIQVGRVTDIILNGDYPAIEKYGGLNGIGTIFFELNNRVSDGSGTAKPFFPQVSAYPLVNEIVLIFKLPNTNIGKNTSEESYYYINMISLWNHPHHNAYPNPKKKEDLPSYQQKDYQQTEAGSVRRIGDLDSKDQSTDIDLNSPIAVSQQTFKERTNIHPLLPFAGDIIYQGRWGNSIRFGSTAKSVNLTSGRVDQNPYLNGWSSTGTNGDPIIIIRNGQPSEITQDGKDIMDEGWVPITENVNTDLSSIYQTSTQKIPIQTSNNKFDSYYSTTVKNTPPTKPDQSTLPQCIINSDRLVFNAKKDHVLISGEKSVFLGANSSLNFTSGGNVVIECLDIKLGDKTADEPLIKGNIFLTQLKVVMEKMVALCDSLEGVKNWPNKTSPDGVTNESLDIARKALSKSLTNDKVSGFLDTIEDYKSIVSKTK